MRRSALALLMLVAVGCHEASTVPADKVVGAIRSLPYDVRFRDVPQPPDAELLVAGRLRDPQADVALDFTVRVGEPRAQDAATSCAGAAVNTSSSAAGAQEDEMWRMRAALEDAIFGLAPDVTCEP